MWFIYSHILPFNVRFPTVLLMLLTSISLFIFLLFSFASTLMNCTLKRKQVQEIHKILCPLFFFSNWWNMLLTITPWCYQIWPHREETLIQSDGCWQSPQSLFNVINTSTFETLGSHVDHYTSNSNTLPLKVKNNDSLAVKSTMEDSLLISENLPKDKILLGNPLD